MVPHLGVPGRLDENRTDALHLAGFRVNSKIEVNTNIDLLTYLNVR